VLAAEASVYSWTMDSLMIASIVIKESMLHR